ncbi:acyl-CoA thioesterase [Acidocella aminolytica]|jgi:acyl-CoA thioesterase YciA|uniref:Acyl-CoA thioester hydrolase cytosolic long chain n=1 Tax=Acidocella aminolytica 101 = DSM 11237 TaxID=1120923 RepID=A0A0D6PK26_9PROT|nr:acyl-CoA thioesterase [Acidocella aminolytica]GAN81756.1 acyl-CoA thioester hydrolase cytosolic long chain [Acidocella aminolytica 101 = DSM 11237]GBQ38999.1 acyl-CoA thioester hydrolase [Acidocella aminolytica 101 = DSM 11237]SHF47161.1 acyl-CoA thioesterase YciA [Acidocella aminolytica 101 = DSM 11237]
MSDRACPPDTMPMIRAIAMPADANANGDIFGGWLMSQMDLAAGNLAQRAAHGRCVTVSVEAMSFIRPVKVGDEVSVYCELLSTGRTSMNISVEAWRRERAEQNDERVTKAVFKFVAIDSTGRPRPLPGKV